MRKEAASVKNRPQNDAEGDAHVRTATTTHTHTPTHPNATDIHIIGLDSYSCFCYTLFTSVKWFKVTSHSSGTHTFSEKNFEKKKKKTITKSYCTATFGLTLKLKNDMLGWQLQAPRRSTAEPAL